MRADERRRYEEAMEANRMLFEALAHPVPLRIRLRWKAEAALDFVGWMVRAALLGASAGLAFVMVVKAAGLGTAF